MRKYRKWSSAASRNERSTRGQPVSRCWPRWTRTGPGAVERWAAQPPRSRSAKWLRSVFWRMRWNNSAGDVTSAVPKSAWQGGMAPSVAGRWWRDRRCRLRVPGSAIPMATKLSWRYTGVETGTRYSSQSRDPARDSCFGLRASSLRLSTSCICPSDSRAPVRALSSPAAVGWRSRSGQD